MDIYIDPFEDSNLEVCPMCNGEINPFGIILEESCGFLGLGTRRTEINSCLRCDYKIERSVRF